ncbi:MAG: orotidine-5'-phosphate decarboxylase [Betaproteobacteria bacterium]|jgi:orotidine-5'-phosphate decarboxylase|nr:orotidine-5'-phosphate decarboxylase [Betaproteobacteria bacterium]MDH5341662.1 orotidine-5'-phosphate decarboxylase [Betaproteobacteria bacterium]
MSAGKKGSRVVVALDFQEVDAALDFVRRLDPALCRIKVGKELFTVAGPALVEQLAGRGFDVFLDLKYHDIPNTVAAACKSAAALGVWMMNVHASGGRAMMQAAREALAGLPRPPLLIAVTVLTSLNADDLREIGHAESPQALAERLARLAAASGMDGVVCSAQEAPLLRRACGQSFCLVTPGIRLADTAQDDQKRIVTPQTAISNGADYLVVGRPITRAADPLAVLERINADVSAALSR